MTEPIPMRLCCEGCGKLHIDEGEFASKPHHTHSCQYCGLTWRPAVVHTVGVQFLPGFKNDPLPLAIGPIEAGSQWTRITDGKRVTVKEHSGSCVTLEGIPETRYAEGSFRQHFRPDKPITNVVDDVVIRCVFAGEECAITIDPSAPLSEVCRRLRVRTHRESRPTSDWEIRNIHGQLLPQHVRIQDVPGLQDCARKVGLHISLPVGSGG
jgi:hypothetical protein